MTKCSGALANSLNMGADPRNLKISCFCDSRHVNIGPQFQADLPPYNGKCSCLVGTCACMCACINILGVEGGWGWIPPCNEIVVFGWGVGGEGGVGGGGGGDHCFCMSRVLSRWYLLNHRTFCNQAWHNGASSWAGLLCQKLVCNFQGQGHSKCSCSENGTFCSIYLLNYRSFCNQT